MATVKGVWVFNDTLSFPAATIRQDVYFTTDPNSGAAYSDWTRIRVYTTMLDYERYLGGGGTAQTVYRDGKWKNAVQRVDFGEKELTVSDTFYEWFTANAKPEAGGESGGESGGVIVINGTVSEEIKQQLLDGGTHPVARRHGNLIIAGGEF